MDPTITLHLGRYRKYLHDELNLIIIFGAFPEVAISRELYNESHGVSESDAEAVQLMKQIMGTCALVAHSLAERESFGWTLSLKDSPLGVFCGVEPEGMICARVRPAMPERSSVYVQRHHKDAPMTQSHYDPETTDPVKAIQRYFETSDQQPTRIELDEEFSGVMVQALPGGDVSSLFALSAESFLATTRKLLAENQLKPLSELLVFYECRCDDKMILDMITSLPKNQRKDLWGDETELAIECPRCGREYILHKKDTLH